MAGGTAALEVLDRLISADPTATAWSFEDHARGSLHEAERLMTLKGAEAQTVTIAAPRGPRSITAVRIKRRGGPAPGTTMAPDARGIADAPGTAELCRFLSLLSAINRNCPWAPHAFSANDAILRELVSNHLNLIVGEERATRHGGRLRALIGSGLTPSNLCWISASRAPAPGPGPYRSHRILTLKHQQTGSRERRPRSPSSSRHSPSDQSPAATCFLSTRPGSTAPRRSSVRRQNPPQVDPRSPPAHPAPGSQRRAAPSSTGSGGPGTLKTRDSTRSGSRSTTPARSGSGTPQAQSTRLPHGPEPSRAAAAITPPPSSSTKVGQLPRVSRLVRGGSDPLFTV